MTRSAEFLKLHKKFETHMRERLHLSEYATNRDLLDGMIKAGDSTVRTNVDFLRNLGNLRNILAHLSLGTEYVAELSPQALEKFEKIVNGMLRPPLIREIASKPVKVFEETNTLLDALNDMKAHDYSQIVVRTTGHLGLVSPEGITQWLLTESLEAEVLEPKSVELRAVAAHEPKPSCRFMRPDQTVDEARAAFLDGGSAPSTRLWAILLTHSAKSSEQPLGIVTPWNVFEP